jgi:hypothetical protein
LSKELLHLKLGQENFQRPIIYWLCVSFPHTFEVKLRCLP